MLIAAFDRTIAMRIGGDKSYEHGSVPGNDVDW